MDQERPTIVDVARAAGVSLSTASRALNGLDRVGPSTREKVTRAAEKLGYRPNIRAQRLRTGRSHSIALVSALPAQVVNESSELGFMLELSMPIAQACLTRDYALVLVPPISRMEQLDSLDVDGAIVLDAGEGDEITERLRSRGVCVVAFGRATRVDGYLDRGAAGADVMFQHLRQEGAEHVCVLLSEESYSVTESVLQYLEGGDVPVRYSIIRAEANHGKEAGKRSATAALLNDPSIDAIYAPIDAFAVGAVEAATELGLEIPARLMVSTNYNGRRAAESQPPLTALELSFPEIGRDLVRLLFESLDSSSSALGSLPSPTIIPRESTARHCLSLVAAQGRGCWLGAEES